MPLGKRHFLILGLIVAVSVSVVVVIATKALRASSPIEKIGKIKDISYLGFVEPNKPSCTILKFEDGDDLLFKGIIGNIEIGRTYHIIYHKQHQICVGPDHPVGLHGGRALDWSGEYYILDSIEEVK